MGLLLAGARAEESRQPIARGQSALAALGFEAISLKDNELILTVKRTIVPNRIVLYRRFRNEARVQQGVIRIPRRLFGANWFEQLRELLPAITVAA